MFALPAAHQALLASFPLPSDFRKLPENIFICAIVRLTSEYREILPDFTKPQVWAKFKSFIAERSHAVDIGQHYIRLYEHEEYPIRAFFKLSFITDLKQMVIAFAEKVGYGDIAQQDILAADPGRLRSFLKLAMDGPAKEILADIDSWDFTDEDVAQGKYYWQVIHPTLPPDEQSKVERDVGLFLGLLFFTFHNVIAVWAYGESMTSLVCRALAGGKDADQAMCKAVRVDGNLRQHPKFLARYLAAHGQSDDGFHRKYNNTATPLPSRVRYPGLYFLLAFLDCHGLLSGLTNPQLLELCDHAKLHKWENRIEDEGYMGKRRREYESNKFRQLSRHSN